MFIILYQFPNEELRETINATVHGFIATVLHGMGSRYRLYVLPMSWLTRPYLIAIEPFRRIRRAWIATYARNI